MYYKWRAGGFNINWGIFTFSKIRSCVYGDLKSALNAYRGYGCLDYYYLAHHDFGLGALLVMTGQGESYI